MDNQHNPQVLIDKDFTLAEGTFTSNYIGDRTYFIPDDAFYGAAKDLYFGLVNAKIEISNIKKSVGDEYYEIQVLVDKEIGDDIVVTQITIPRTILDTHQDGFTYFLPFVLDAKAIHCEMSLGGTLPSITCSVNIVKEI